MLGTEFGTGRDMLVASGGQILVAGRNDSTGNMTLWKYIDNCGQCVVGNGMIQIASMSKYIPTPIIKYETLSEKDVYSYPNPSQGDTTIRFTLAMPEDIYLAIMDINGNRVWTHVVKTGDTKEGINKIDWKGLNDNNQQIANGVYLFIIQAGNKTVKKKIAIIR
jgi:hypothetical protein